MHESRRMRLRPRTWWTFNQRRRVVQLALTAFMYLAILTGLILAVRNTPVSGSLLGLPPKLAVPAILVAVGVATAVVRWIYEARCRAIFQNAAAAQFQVCPFCLYELETLISAGGQLIVPQCPECGQSLAMNHVRSIWMDDYAAFEEEIRTRDEDEDTNN